MICVLPENGLVTRRGCGSRGDRCKVTGRQLAKNMKITDFCIRNSCYHKVQNDLRFLAPTKSNESLILHEQLWWSLGLHPWALRAELADTHTHWQTHGFWTIGTPNQTFQKASFCRTLHNLKVLLLFCFWLQKKKYPVLKVSLPEIGGSSKRCKIVRKKNTSRKKGTKHQLRDQTVFFLYTIHKNIHFRTISIE